MPEGHTLHRLARDLEQSLKGKRLSVTSPQGRFPEAASLDGATLQGAFALGKHLFLQLDAARVHIHLGLFGKMKRQKLTSAPRPTARLRLVSDELAWELTGPTRCELQSAEQFETLRARLGADPLGESARPRTLGQRLRRSQRSIGALLLDQSLFAGIGNVYRAEILFLAKLDPNTPGNALTSADVDRVWRLAKELLRRGAEANRIVTVKGAHRRTKRADSLYCYKRSTCRVCEGGISRTTSGGRAMFHCPVCQPPRLTRERVVAVSRGAATRGRARARP